ncbi:MAG: CdaR family protein [Capsulimonadales bacterium]|nr:CdaR family protein [Capsulimonadales bacterium]
MISLLRRNLGYKLLSLAIGILLYGIAFVQNNPRVTREVVIPPDAIQIRNPPGDLYLKSGPQSIGVTVQGPMASIEAFRMQPIKAFLDLSRAKVGKYRAPLRFPTDSPAEVLVPVTAEVEIARKVRKSFSVVVRYNQTPPPGYVYSEPTATPPTVNVIGPESEVAKVRRVVGNLQNPVNGGSLNASVDVVAETDREEPVENIELDPRRVAVVLQLKKAPATKLLVLSANISGSPAPGYAMRRYVFSPATIAVSGPVNQLANLTAIEVPINIQGITASEQRTVSLTLPPGVARTDRNSNRVTIRLEMERMERISPPPLLPSPSPIVPSPQASPKTGPAPTATPIPTPSGSGAPESRPDTANLPKEALPN